ncbi:MAG: 16S rRNA (cytidine(1402)-2'-O)-methyltransferase [Geobacteraceae bacterium]|nr:16S rRNA (cytidine(1402)-2'-O)-methyltransferase [Geobacteraceae bacterium]
MKKGTLYIVATPIGNLEDMTFRAVRILKEVDVIAAEDTRHSRKLLTHFGISNSLTSYFDHNKQVKGELILDKLCHGLSVALVSDAGTPCISDPGFQLVRDAVKMGITVVPVPGACAAVAVLSVSGLPTDSYAFEGFLPNRKGKRREKISSLSEEKRVLVFYESPNRLLDTLSDIFDLLGDRTVVVAREVTKIYEEFLRGPVSEILHGIAGKQVRGEIVLMVAPSDKNAAAGIDEIEGLLEKYLCIDGISVKDAVRKVAMESGQSKSRVYEAALQIKK